jgi:hypothetical protein
MFTKDFEIPAGNLEGLRGRLVEVNKKAAKLGVPDVTMTVGDKMVKTIMTPDGGSTLEAIYFNVTINGEVPRYDGWGFTASLELTDEGSLIRTMPGMECPPEHRERGNVCDHCGTNRRRANTYVVVHDDGRSMNVGKNCLKDFMGSNRLNPALFANYFSYLLDCFDSPEGFGGFRHGDPTYDIATVLEVTGAVISSYGWVSGGMIQAGKHPGPSTASEVRTFLNYNDKHASQSEKLMVAKVKAELEATRELRIAEGQAAVAWITGDEHAKPANDYIHTIRVLAKRGWLGRKDFGFGCSILSGWRNAMSRKADREREAAASGKVPVESQHVGTIKERREFTLKVNRVMALAGAFGVTHLHLMEDADGNRFKWFGSTSLDESEDFVTVKATVKNHGEYKGIKETILNRVVAA